LTAFGCPFTHQHVGHICRRDSAAHGRVSDTTRTRGTPKRSLIC
jgi:hypothetical protein